MHVCVCECEYQHSLASELQDNSMATEANQSRKMVF